MSLEDILHFRLNDRKSEGLFRELKIVNGLIDFYSNDYLGLSRSPDLRELIVHNYNSLPVSNGATGSRLLSGNSAYAESIESELAQIFRAASALLFNSGYAANMAVLSSLPRKGDTIIYDELSHACIKDGARLSHATRFSFRHNDLNDLEKKLSKSTGKIFIAVESIYSMDGDQCPLVDLITLAERYEASIILDEAHSTGTFGADGSGLSVSLGMEKQIDIRIHTFGKAMGIHGACVVGSEKLKEYLINFARPFIYTTALPLHSLVAIRCAFNFLKTNIELQKMLRQKIDSYLVATSKITTRTQSNSSIQTLITPGNSNAKSIANQLLNSGFDIRPILSPTVREGKERLRICLHTFNSDSDIINLSSHLERITQLQVKA